MSSYQLVSSLESSVLALGFHQPDNSISANNETDYPIGETVVASCEVTAYARNASNAIKYSSAVTYAFVHSSMSGTALSGTWRAKGFCGGDAGGQGFYLFQRTA